MDGNKENETKSKYIILNFTYNYQFATRLYMNEILLDCEREMKLLGTIISSNLSWSANTNNLIKKAYARMLMLRTVYSFGLSLEDLIQIYSIYIRCYIEQNCIVWSSSLTIELSDNIERVQKVALRICLKDGYLSYENALNITGLQTLAERREMLSVRFARKCVRHPEMNEMFPLNKNVGPVTRDPQKFFVQPANTDRLRNSAIPYMQRLLNQYRCKMN